jgi:AraC-like DNA-binding protein
MVTSRMPPRIDALSRVKERAFALVPHEGHAQTTDPDLCLFRFSRPTKFAKAATFGITAGVVLQGRKRLHVGGHVLEVPKHHLIVITRDTELQGEAVGADEDVPYLGMSLLFPPERVARALLAFAETGAPTDAETVPAFSMPIDAPIAEAFERLLRTFDDPVERTLISPLIVDEILFRLLRTDAAAAVRRGVGHPADAQRILDAMQYIRANHTAKLDIDKLARTVAMSPSHFAHRFRAVARTTPMRYVREVRLERAKALLAEQGARAGEVATQVGFESAAHFAREFKRRYGHPPTHLMRPLAKQ